MKRPSPRWIATPLAACLALALGGCGTLGKKGESAAAEATAGSGDTSKKEEQKKEKPGGTRPATETSTPAPADPPPPAEAAIAADPAAAEEFGGLPKGEADFLIACRALGAGGKATMTGRDGYVFDTRDLAALGSNSKSSTPRHQAIVAAVAAYAEKLRAAGVELVLAPVAPKPVVYPDFLGGDQPLKDRRYDSYLQALYSELQKAGVRVVDETKSLRSDRSKKGSASFPQTGLIWSPAAAAATARAIHASTRRTAPVKSITRDKTIVSRDSSLTQNGESFKARSVGWAQGDRLVPATVAKEGAAILVIGDEHAAAHRTDGVNASLADQLSLAFGTPVETRATPGLGWQEAVAAFTPAEGSPTKLVVWNFAAADFLDTPAASPKQSARPPRRNPGRAAERSSDSPGPRSVPAPLDGAGLRLRDDPGLEARPE